MIRIKEYWTLCEATRNACSRTSSSMPGCSGSTTSSPGAFRENAMRPGPLATVTMCGIPAMDRFMPPPVFSEESGTVSSFHSST